MGFPAALLHPVCVILNWKEENGQKDMQEKKKLQIDKPLVCKELVMFVNSKFSDSELLICLLRLSTTSRCAWECKKAVNSRLFWYGSMTKFLFVQISEMWMGGVGVFTDLSDLTDFGETEPG